jgi:hypothetical protein
VIDIIDVVLFEFFPEEFDSKPDQNLHLKVMSGHEQTKILE